MKNSISDFDTRIERVADILNSEKAPLVSRKTLIRYLEYLRKNVTLPCELTGIEDFLWEEFYVLGPGDPAEYEEEKKTKASYTDTFKLIDFEDYIDEYHGILVKTKRIIGVNKKHFTLGLDWLKCTDGKSKNHQLIRDYAVWFCNYR